MALSGAAERQALVARQRAETAAVVDATLRTTDLARGHGAAVALSDLAAQRRVDLVRLAGDVAAVAHASSEGRGYGRATLDAAAVTDGLTRGVEAGRILSDSFAFAAGFDRARAALRFGDHDLVIVDGWSAQAFLAPPIGPPRPRIVSVTSARLSSEAGYDAVTVEFVFDQPVVRWEARIIFPSVLGTDRLVARWSGDPAQGGTAVVPAALLGTGENVLALYGLDVDGQWTPPEYALPPERVTVPV